MENNQNLPKKNKKSYYYKRKKKSNNTLSNETNKQNDLDLYKVEQVVSSNTKLQNDNKTTANQEPKQNVAKPTNKKKKYKKKNNIIKQQENKSNNEKQTDTLTDKVSLEKQENIKNEKPQQKISEPVVNKKSNNKNKKKYVKKIENLQYDNLKIYSLGGLGVVGMNMYVVEQNEELIIIDVELVHIAQASPSNLISFIMLFSIFICKST